MAEHRARVRAHEKELERQKAKAEAEQKEKEKKAAEEEAARAAAPTSTEGDVSTEAAPAGEPPAAAQETSAQPERMEGLPELWDVDRGEKDEGEKLEAAPIGPCEAETVLKELPAKELSYLCRLLAHQG